MDDPEHNVERDYDRKLARGARINALGTLGKLLHPLYLVLATRLYGPEVLGLYIVAVSLVELAASILVGGFKDGIVMFGGRGDHERDAEHRATLYRVLASSIFVVGVLCLLLVLVASLAGRSLLDVFFSYNATAVGMGDRIEAVLPILVWTLPCIAVMELGLAATKSLMRMEYDAILVGLSRPMLLIVSAVVAWFVVPGLQGLLWAYLVTHALLALGGVWAFMRHFSLLDLGRTLLRPRLERQLLAFAVPQSLNQTLNNFITNVDRLMLAYFGVAPELIAFYGTAAVIMRNIRQAKLAFSGAFAPVIARLHAERRIARLEESFGVVARWALTIAVPGVIAVLGLRQELLLLFHRSYTHDSAFMILLAVPPLLSCWVGLAGNIVVMTGHSQWNLFNSVLVGIANAALNALWIPLYGLWGAALATALATLGVSLLQLVEAKLLVGVRARLDLVYKPILAGMAAAVVLLVAAWLGDSTVMRAMATVAALVVYALSIRAMGLDPRDRELLRFKKPRLSENLQAEGS